MQQLLGHSDDQPVLPGEKRTKLVLDHYTTIFSGFLVCFCISEEEGPTLSLGKNFANVFN